jgi:hypothetical protein
MLRGIFQRAAVATLLMGTLIAPAGVCLQQMHKAGHDCCAGASESGSSVRNDCCIARTTLPAVVAPVLSGPTPLTVSQEVVVADEASSLNVSPALAIIPPQSPPTGASILRI